jgi:myosin heavy chain 9/10/11/14
MFYSKKIKSLLKENDELKSKFQDILNKEENINNLNEVLIRIRIEVAELNDERRGLIKSIDTIRINEENKRLEVEELCKKIGHLHEMKNELQNDILSYTNQIDNIESSIKANHNKLSSNNVEDQNINEIESINSDLIKEKKEIESYIERTKSEARKLNEEEVFLINRKEALSEEITRLEDKLTNLQKTCEDLEEKVNKGNEIITEPEIKQEGNLLAEKIKALKSEETSRLSRLKEIESELSERTELKTTLEQEHLMLMSELNEKRKILEQTQDQYKKLLKDTKIIERELFDTQQTLSIKAQKLSNINIELMDYDKKYGSVKNEITELEHFRNELLRSIQREKETAGKFADQNRKLTELVPLLEKRKQEIEQGNAELEGRFTVMFQKFNNELNQINRKRSVLEQIVLKKEKDVDEKDQLLFEKIASLEESERVLNMRQVEIESLEKQIGQLKEHKDVSKNDLNKMDQETLERRNYTEDLRLETELLLKKKVTLEKNLQELLQYMNDSYEHSRDRNSKFEIELNYYEDQIQGYRTRIADSLKELDDIKASVGALKIEHEEYRGNISRLASFKKKLYEEILKHQTILQRYQKVREKLKMEQTTGKSFEDIAPKGKSAFTTGDKKQQNINL